MWSMTDSDKRFKKSFETLQISDLISGFITNHEKIFSRSGRSTGQAEIEFSSYGDAERARDQYNGVPLDGKRSFAKLTHGKMWSKFNFTFRSCNENQHGCIRLRTGWCP